MSDPRPTNPYVAPSAGDERRSRRPATRRSDPVDARTQQAILTQAFLWMFVGLAVTAAVAFVVQSNERLLRVRREQPLHPDHRPVRPGLGDRLRASAA